MTQKNYHAACEAYSKAVELAEGNDKKKCQEKLEEAKRLAK